MTEQAHSAEGRHRRGETHGCHRLTEAQVMEMRARASDGETLAELHRAFPQCSKPNIHHIINGRRWRYLLPIEGA